jgi:hypothetical protein
MKSLANGYILQSGAVTATECLQYALQLPTSVVITGIDRPEYIDQAVDAVRTLDEMTPSRVRELLARTAQPASRGEFELFKTSSVFDATAQNPQWLGQESSRVRQSVAQ